jgi:excisionase family DNA binding protein
VERLTLTIEDAARLLGIGRGSAYEAARRGEIPVIRVGRRLLVPQEGLAAMLAGPSRMAVAGTAAPTRHEG